MNSHSYLIVCLKEAVLNKSLAIIFSILALLALVFMFLIPKPPQSVFTAVSNNNNQDRPHSTLFIGEYRYMADAAQFKVCSTKQIYPVLFAGDHLAMEQRYLYMNPTPAEWIAADVEGYLKTVPHVDTKQPIQVLYVTKFIRFDRTVSCPK